jgi:hypothetical protein
MAAGLYCRHGDGVDVGSNRFILAFGTLVSWIPSYALHRHQGGGGTVVVVVVIVTKGSDKWGD